MMDLNKCSNSVSWTSRQTKFSIKYFLIAELTSDHFRESKGRTSAEIMQQTGGLGRARRKDGAKPGKTLMYSSDKVVQRYIVWMFLNALCPVEWDYYFKLVWWCASNHRNCPKLNNSSKKNSFILLQNTKFYYSFFIWETFRQRTLYCCLKGRSFLINL